MKPMPAVMFSWNRLFSATDSDAPATPASAAPRQTLK